MLGTIPGFAAQGPPAGRRFSGGHRSSYTSMICRFLAASACALTLVAGSAARAAKPTQQRFALTRYFYGYQADTRKPLPPGQPTLAANGSSLFAVNPMNGLGPWFGYGHAMWQRDNLMAMRHAGIDVALPVFRADKASLSGYAERGLDSMVQALIELKREERDYPLIGMFYDTTSLGAAGSPLDVSTLDGKEAFYNGIRRFFRRIPEEFRALAQEPNGLACIVSVGSSTHLSGLDAGLRKYCDEQFQQDFGRRILWVGDADWSPKGGLDAYASFNEGRGLKVNTDGFLSIATVGPGYNDTALAAKGGTIVPRRGGVTMLDDWRNLFAGKGADWIIVETWNDFAHGSAVAPSRSFGVRDMDATMAGLLQFRGENGVPAQALRVNAPEIAPPKAVLPVEVVVQNGSLEQWGRGNIAFSASWYQNGKLIEDGPKIPVLEQVPVMGLMHLPVAAVTAKADGTPLPDGNYQLRVELFKIATEDGKTNFVPFSTKPAALIPMRIGTPPAPVARLLSSDLSPYLMAGGKATSRIVVRNDGPTAWPKGKTRIAWVLIGGPNPLSSASIAHGESAPFEADVPPGMVSPVTTLDISIPKDTAPSADNGNDYFIQWQVVSGTETLPVTSAPGATALRAVEVLPELTLAHFPIGNSAPATWQAGTEQEIRAAIQNNGATTWKAGTVQLGYHWYYWDGTEALWEGQRTPLTKDLAPGESIMARLKATAPENAGAYVFVVDVWDGKEWISTLPGTAGFDTTLAYVNVQGGNLRPVDLTGLFDVDGISNDGNPADGDFDGGFTYPAEQMPPDVQPPLRASNAPPSGFPPGIQPIMYPAGYFGPVDTVGLQSIRRIPFRYPSARDGERNFMLGRGQDLPLGEGSYNHIYILGAATKDTTGTFRLQYTDGTSDDVPVQLSGWTDGPKHGEPVGLRATFRNSANGPDTTRAYLYIYDIPANPAKTLKAIVLPENRAFRIAAITADQKPTFQLPKPVL